MKAMVCPQCGATLENIAETTVITVCNYCGAKVLVREQEEKRGPEPEPHDTLHIPLENYKPFDDYDPLPPGDDGLTIEEVTARYSARAITAVLVITGIFFALVIAGVVLLPKTRKKSAESAPQPYRISTPRPPVNVEAVTREDAISVPQPVVPKNVRVPRRVDIEVYISVDEQGNVYDANANTNNEALGRIAKEAALQAKFRPSTTGQRSSGVLVYTFGPK